MFSKMSCVVRLAGRKGVAASGRRLQSSEATSEKLLTFKPERMGKSIGRLNTSIRENKEVVAVAIAGFGGALGLGVAATWRYYSLSDRAIGAEANAKAAAAFAEAATAKSEKAASDNRAEVAIHRAELEVSVSADVGNDTAAKYRMPCETQRARRSFRHIDGAASNNDASNDIRLCRSASAIWWCMLTTGRRRRRSDNGRREAGHRSSRCAVYMSHGTREA